MDDTDATAPVQGIPSAALRNNIVENQQCDSVSCVPQKSWDDFYRTEMSRLVRYLMQVFGDADMHDAASAANNAFLELFKQWDTVDHPVAWLRKVAFRQMLRHPVRAEYSLDVLRHEPAAVSELEFREQSQAVLHGLRQLPLTQRQVLALVIDGFSHREIASILDINEPAVRKNLERARRKMKELLEIS